MGFNRNLTFTVALLVSLVVVGCNNRVADPAASNDDTKPTKIVAVSYALQCFTKDLIGDAAEVIMPDYQKVRPEKWKPEITFIRELQSADLIVTNGAGATVAPWLNGVTLANSRVLETINNVNLSDLILIDDAPVHTHGPEGEHSHNSVVATIWLDPVIAKDQSKFIAIRLCKLFPSLESTIKENEKALEKQFDALLEDFTKHEHLNGKTVLSSEPSFENLLKRLGIVSKHYFWSQESSEITEQMWIEFDETRPDSATVMIWPGQPNQDIVAKLKQRNIEIVVLDLIELSTSGDYFEIQQTNLAALNKALE